MAEDSNARRVGSAGAERPEGVEVDTTVAPDEFRDVPRSRSRNEGLRGDLTLDEAKKAAWELYGTDAPAVVELLLLAHNAGTPAIKRLQANMALEWFDPSVVLPRSPREEELPAVRAIRWCVYAFDPAARKQAAIAAVFHLERWSS